MTHRTRFMIAAMAPALAVVVMTVVAPGTNSQFTDTDTGTMNITFSNDPSRSRSSEVKSRAMKTLPIVSCAKQERWQSCAIRTQR